MKRVNINRDVRSREQIATVAQPTIQVEPIIVEPLKTEEADAKSEEIQGGEIDPQSEQTITATSKRGRKTKRNKEEV